MTQHRHEPSNHGARCYCGRRARWHVDCWVVGCANLCGIHARVVQRQSLYTAIFGPPIVVDHEEAAAV